MFVFTFDTCVNYWKANNKMPDILFSITLQSDDIKTMIKRCLKADRKNCKLNFKIKSILSYTTFIHPHKIKQLITDKVLMLELSVCGFEMVNKLTFKYMLSVTKIPVEFFVNLNYLTKYH